MHTFHIYHLLNLNVFVGAAAACSPSALLTFQHLYRDVVLDIMDSTSCHNAAVYDANSTLQFQSEAESLHLFTTLFRSDIKYLYRTLRF